MEKKHTHIGGPMQFTPVLFKGQLYYGGLQTHYYKLFVIHFKVFLCFFFFNSYVRTVLGSFSKLIYSSQHPSEVVEIRKYYFFSTA